jgi:hypothetical protein
MHLLSFLRQRTPLVVHLNRMSRPLRSMRILRLLTNHQHSSVHLRPAQTLMQTQTHMRYRQRRILLRRQLMLRLFQHTQPQRTQLPQHLMLRQDTAALRPMTHTRRPLRSPRPTLLACRLPLQVRPRSVSRLGKSQSRPKSSAWFRPLTTRHF